MDAATIAAVAALITAVTTPFVAVYLASRLKSVNKQLNTLNEKQIGQLAAEDETRRIEEIPRPERTRTEQRHVDEAPPKEPPQGPGR